VAAEKFFLTSAFTAFIYSRSCFVKIRNLRKNQRHAFTLIELLVVVSIIALLVSILLPALGRARDQAKAVLCMTRLKQIGTAWVVYAAQNNDYVLPHRQQATASKNWLAPTWFPQVLGPYTDNSYELWNCPSRDKSYYLDASWRNSYGWYISNYPYNAYIGGRLTALSTGFANASSQIIFGEGWGDEFWANATAINNYMLEPHKKRMNAIFIDGHVKPIAIKDIMWQLRPDSNGSYVIYAY
jgi:prepilin-type N-terminal cleavage/methylation domain-containing protein/prepilin-type processing-associated H-X9-DG protein